MTEKHYGGDSGVKNTGNLKKPIKSSPNISTKKKSNKASDKKSEEKKEIENYKKAGKIAKQAVEYAKSIIKKDIQLEEIADKIEAKILELGGKPAFPVNLSINEIAAHYTPIPNDTTLASGLLKIDIGVQIDGYVADTAFSIDLENSEENKKLIQAAEEALRKALEISKIDTKLKEIGSIIEETIKSFGFHPIQNLSGHSLDQNTIHAGLTIPNFNNSSERQLEKGAYAIEPFSTTGLGSVKDGKPSEIYRLESEGNVRDSFAREVLNFIKEEYQTLPFCSRWIYKKFGSRTILALKRIKDANLIHQYPQLVEKGNGIVAQAEHTILLTETEKIVTTL